MGECIDATKNKHWGAGPHIRPRQPDDPVSPDRILYAYKPESPYNRPFLQRRRVKKLLGKGHRRLVGRAMSMRKGDFLDEVIDVDARAIRERLNASVGDLWRAVRSKLFLTLPRRTVQMEFEFGE